MDDKKREEIKLEIARIKEDHNGQLTPDMVIEAARKPNSPLYSCFTWNIKEAARLYWREEAREIIRWADVIIVKDTPEFPKVEYPLYVRNPDKNANEQGYVHIPDVEKGSIAAKKIVLRVLNEAEYSVGKVVTYAKLLGIQEDVSELSNTIADVKAKLLGVAVQPPVS